jgi:tripartite-type tricarboxylate transporter receptor subunit TctC
MKAVSRRTLGTFIAALLLASLTTEATAQAAADYPAKPVQFVICYAPGGGLDVVGRIVAEQLTRNLGRQIVVENRPGAGGNIGTAFVAKAPSDGYTLLETTNSHNINPLIYRNAGYDPRRDFVAVAQLTEAPSVIVANPRGPFASLKEMMAAARAAPGKLVYGSAGNGSPTNIAMEMFKAVAGLDITHVPYKSAAQSHVDVMGGQTPLAMAALPSAMTHLQSGALRALAITSEKRWPTVKEVPTVAEAGYPGFSHMTWIGVLAPSGTSGAIVTRLNKEIAAVLATAEVRERIARTGAEPVVRGAAEFEDMLKSEYEATGKLVAKIGIKVE